ncbi:hypothetical protein D9M68_874410 [compost metagenome]
MSVATAKMRIIEREIEIFMSFAAFKLEAVADEVEVIAAALWESSSRRKRPK